MERVTVKHLQQIVDRINRITDSPMVPYTMVDGKYKANIGNYHLSGAYGGWALHRICNDGGGVDDVLRIGHTPKRELRNAMFAFITGLEAGK